MTKNVEGVRSWEWGAGEDEKDKADKKNTDAQCPMPHTHFQSRYLRFTQMPSSRLLISISYLKQ